MAWLLVPSPGIFMHSTLKSFHRMVQITKNMNDQTGSSRQKGYTQTAVSRKACWNNLKTFSQMTTENYIMFHSWPKKSSVEVFMSLIHWTTEDWKKVFNEYMLVGSVHMLGPLFISTAYTVPHSSWPSVQQPLADPVLWVKFHRSLIKLLSIDTSGDYSNSVTMMMKWGVNDFLNC